jgi:hypothetical protein
VTPEIEHLDVSDRRIAYHSRRGASPTLVFLPGYASNMEGAKALALDAFAERRGLAMLRFDYSARDRAAALSPTARSRCGSRKRSPPSTSSR